MSETSGSDKLKLNVGKELVTYPPLTTFAGPREAGAFGGLLQAEVDCVNEEE